jgi:uncharacterized protein YndB with AHSA1/START domain
MTIANEAKNKSKVETKDRELIITRVFSAPRPLVFEAFSDCKHLKHWWGPRLWPLSQCKMDFRPGGEWLYAMKGPEGQESWGKAIYQEIVAPERIVYTDLFSDAEGNANEDMPQLVITLTFSEEEGKTKVVSHAQMASAEELQSLLDMGMLEGLSETWDRLEEYLAQFYNA